jgi:hypothetical protein
MLHALRSLAVLLILLAGAARAAETKPFAREDMASDAVRLTETLRVATAASGSQRQDASAIADRAARAASGGDTTADKLASAATAAPKPVASYAGIAAAAKTRRRMTATTSSPGAHFAAYAAYQHSTTPDAQVRRSPCSPMLAPRAWRPALDCLEGLARPPRLGRRAQDHEAMRAGTGSTFSTTRSITDPLFLASAGFSGPLAPYRFSPMRGIGSRDGDLRSRTAHLRRRA